MNTTELQEAILVSTNPMAPLHHHQEASMIIEKFRGDRNRWTISLQLFLESNHLVIQFFALTITREYLEWSQVFTGSNIEVEAKLTHCKVIRNNLMSWLNSKIATKALCTFNDQCPQYLLNNVISIISLCLKLEYPKQWPTAIIEILEISRKSGILEEIRFITVDIVVRIFVELGLEIVVYNDKRCKNEIEHNMMIKDAMRESGILFEIVSFLCQTAVSTVLRNKQVAVSCLQCLSQFISWIDINIVITLALPTIWGGFDDQNLGLSHVCCVCLFEIMKKGMESSLKIQLIKAIGIVDKFQQLNLQDRDIAFLVEFGPLVNMIGFEALLYWSSYEDQLKNSKFICNESNIQIVSAAANTLKLMSSLSLYLFRHYDNTVAATVLPFLSRFPSIFKIQNEISYQFPIPERFIAKDYIQDLLMGIFQQVQYPSDFEFDEESEEDLEVIEAKNDILKLFVSCCRVEPDICLQLISTAMQQAVPQPLSRAPFPILEATLHLMFSFAESGSNNMNLVTTGVFPMIINALKDSDIAFHSNPHVLKIYYNLVVRYLRHSLSLKRQEDIDILKHIVDAMIGSQGVRHPVAKLRIHVCSLLYKVTNALDCRASMLIDSVGTFIDLMVSDLSNNSKVNLPYDGELHLLEVFGLVTCSYVGGESNVSVVAIQHQMLKQMIQLLSKQMFDYCLLLNNPTYNQANLYAVVTHKINCLAAVIKSSKFSNIKDNLPTLHLITEAGIIVSKVAFSIDSSYELRHSIVMFLHCLILSMGPEAMKIILGGFDASMQWSHDVVISSSLFSILLEKADSRDIDDVNLLLSQCITEFEQEALSFTQILLPRCMSRYVNIIQEFESSQQGSEAPHIEVERSSLQKNFLAFLQHLCNSSCYIAVVENRQPQTSNDSKWFILSEICRHALTGVNGGQGKISVALSIPLRRAAIGVITGLVQRLLCQSSLLLEASRIFRDFVCDQFVPQVFRLSVDKHALNIKDGATQTLLQDIGGLIWVWYANEKEYVINYLAHLLQSLAWPMEFVVKLTELLMNTKQLGQFKDSFKQFIRQTISE